MKPVQKMEHLKSEITRANFDKSRILDKIARRENQLFNAKIMYRDNMIGLDTWHKIKAAYKSKLRYYYYVLSDIKAKIHLLNSDLRSIKQGMISQVRADLSQTVKTVNSELRALLDKHNLTATHGSLIIVCNQSGINVSIDGKSNL